MGLECLERASNVERMISAYWQVCVMQVREEEKKRIITKDESKYSVHSHHQRICLMATFVSNPSSKDLILGLRMWFQKINLRTGK